MITLACSVTGCKAAIHVPPEHAENLTAAGPWCCQSCRVARQIKESRTA